MPKMTEAERDDRIARALAHAKASAGQDGAAFIRELRASFYSENDRRSRVTRSVRSISPSRPRSPKRLALEEHESEIAQDERYVKNLGMLTNHDRYSVLRVIGGTVVEDSHFPDCVAVGNDTGWFCSGTLIADNAVLTAGHCTKCRANAKTPTRVFFGTSTENLEQGKVFSVGSLVRHSEFNDSPIGNDLLVLILKDKVPPAVASPRALATAKLVDDAQQVRLVGFGRTDEDGLMGYGTKRQVDVAIASNSCDGQVRDKSDNEYYGCTPKTELVAGQPALMKDTCRGDSGGPLYVSSDEEWLLAGVTSRAIKAKTRQCGDGGIYTRIDKYRDWIRAIRGINL